jgi:hypothetical protein
VIIVSIETERGKNISFSIAGKNIPFTFMALLLYLPFLSILPMDVANVPGCSYPEG